MDGAGPQQEEADAVALADAMLPSHSLPRRVVSANSGIEVTVDDELVCPGHGCDGVSQILVEFFLYLVRVGHGGDIGADQCGKFLFREWEAGSHQAVINPLGASSQLVDQVGLDDEANSCFASFVLSSPDPEEGVACGLLSKLAFLC